MNLIERHKIQQLQHVSLSIVKITRNKIKRIFDFMGNSSNQLAQRRHFLSLDQLDLGLLNAVERVLKLLGVVLELEF